jgi:hypothetical protein
MTTTTTRLVVGISISEGADLAALGFGAEHLREIGVLVARTVLRLDAGAAVSRWYLAYGGDLRPGGVTWNLVDVARGEGGGDRRLYSYLAWPHYLALSKSEEAELINVCNFVRIRPEDAGVDRVASDRPRDDPAFKDADYVVSRCLSTMRERMTRGGAEVLDGEAAPPLAARIILGGKVSGYSGVMPGIFEEFLLAWEQGVPVFCLGGLGGAARVLAEAAAAPVGTDLPPELRLDWQRAHTGTLDALIAAYACHPEVTQPQVLYERLVAAVQGWRVQLQGAEDAGPAKGKGLTTEEKCRLMQTQDAAQLRRWLAVGLGQIGGGA